MPTPQITKNETTQSPDRPDGDPTPIRATARPMFHAFRGKTGGAGGVGVIASLPPASVSVGRLVCFGLAVDNQQNAQNCCVGEVAQTLHGKCKHHLRTTLHLLEPVAIFRIIFRVYIFRTLHGKCKHHLRTTLHLLKPVATPVQLHTVRSNVCSHMIHADNEKSSRSQQFHIVSELLIN